ncbi:Proteophosphoglycan ppg4 [Rhodotorula toruloides]|nr:Proteophosphoglycan ppg4 [Rhodotorula toruloides]
MTASAEKTVRKQHLFYVGHAPTLVARGAGGSNLITDHATLNSLYHASDVFLIDTFDETEEEKETFIVFASEDGLCSALNVVETWLGRNKDVEVDRPSSKRLFLRPAFDRHSRAFSPEAYIKSDPMHVWSRWSTTLEHMSDLLDTTWANDSLRPAEAVAQAMAIDKTDELPTTALAAMRVTSGGQESDGTAGDAKQGQKRNSAVEEAVQERPAPALAPEAAILDVVPSAKRTRTDSGGDTIDVADKAAAPPDTTPTEPVIAPTTAKLAPVDELAQPLDAPSVPNALLPFAPSSSTAAHETATGAPSTSAMPPMRLIPLSRAPRNESNQPFETLYGGPIAWDEKAVPAVPLNQNQGDLLTPMLSHTFRLYGLWSSEGDGPLMSEETIRRFVAGYVHDQYHVEGVLARPSELAVNGTDLDIIFYSRQEFKWQNERREANKQRLKDWGHYPLRPDAPTVPKGERRIAPPYLGI